MYSPSYNPRIPCPIMQQRKQQPQKAGSKKQPKSKPQGPTQSKAVQPQKGAVVSLSTRNQSIAPRMVKSATSFRVSHRELVLSTVNGSTGFTTQAFIKLNPGLAVTFPWLAPQAQSWDQYRVHRCALEYVPTAPTSTAGEIFLSPNYDSSDPVPTTEAQAANNAGAVSDSCWQRIRLNLDVKAMMGLGPRKFVRPCNVAGDIKTFDVGTVAVCSNNMTGATAVGKLYIDYDIEFFLPNSDPSPVTSPTSLSFYKKAANQSFTSAVAAKLTWDAAQFDPLSIGSGATGTFTPPAGTYKFSMTIGLEDTASEAVTYRIFWAKNGSGTGLTNSQSVVNAAEGVNDITSLSTTEVFSCNGTDTVETWCTITGAAGTLTANGGQCTLTVELV